MADSAQDILKGLGFETGESAYPVTETVSESTLVNAQREAAAKQQGGFLSSLPVAAAEDWIIPSIVENMDRFRSYDGQPVDKFTPELLEQLTGGLTNNDAIGEVLDEALTVGVESALAVKETHLRTEARRKELQEAGWGGTFATFVANMFDPVEWAAIGASTAAVSALSGPAAPVTGTATAVAGTAYKAKKAYSKARAFAAGASVSAAELAAFESIRAGLKYDMDANDVLMTMGFGAGLGGTINTATTAFVKRANVAKLAKIVAEGGELTPAQKLFYEANNVEAVAERLIEKELATEQFLESIDATDTARALGEADEVSVVTPAAKVSQAEAEAIPEIAGWTLFGLRDLISTGYRSAKSEVARIRLGSRLLGMNSVGYKGGKLEAEDSASEIAERIQGQNRVPFAYMLHPNQRKWKKRTGGSIEDFNRLVSRYARGIITDVDPEVKAVGDLLKKQERVLAEMGIKYDVAGFTPSMLDRHANYLARIFNDQRIRDIRARLGDTADEQIAELVEAAIRKGQPNIIEDLANSIARKASKTKQKGARSVKSLEEEAEALLKRMARGYTKSITDPKLGKTGGPATVNEMTLEDLIDVMKVEFRDELDDSDIEDLIGQLTRAGKTKGHKRSRPRLVLDESTSIRVTRADGEVEDLHFYELLEEDAEQLHNSYIFQMSGAIGLARKGINTNQKGSSWEEFLASIDKEVKAKNLDPDKAAREKRALQFMYDGITGRLAHREEVSNRAREWNIGIRAFSFAVNMGMSGMSAMMELSNALFEYTVTTLLRTMPAYNQLYKKASKGQLEDGLMKELIEGLGVGGEVQLGRYNRATRYEGSNVEGYIGPEQHWAGKAALKSQQFVSYWSGLNGVTQTLRRMSMLNYSTQWVRSAKKGGMPFSDIKLKQLGITNEMAEKIKQTINKNATFKGTTLDRLNLEKWPEDVREAFQASGFKEARQSVQEMNIASTNGFLRSELGKTLFQFLSFPLASLEQQTMRLGVRAVGGDIAATKVMLSAAMMGSLMYMARVQLNAAGRGDADEYIQERMKPKNFATGALSQIGAASMFSYIYQLSTGAMDGNTYAMTPPAVSLAQSTLQALTAYNNGEISEAEYRRMLRILPAQSLYGMRQAINALANELGN